jgi:uncharacterized DUF497 family protein
MLRIKGNTEFPLKKLNPYFSTKMRFSFYDEDHSEQDDRFIMLGLSIRSRILVVCHCERIVGKVIRIISARKATSSERKFYVR